jgi:hypothetical protein
MGSIRGAVIAPVVGAALLVAVTACGAGGATPASTPTTTSAAPSVSSTQPLTVTTAPTPSASALPHFATPSEAARYLAAKWNANDDAALHHITNDDSRAQLANMHTFAANDLTLDKCTKNPDLTYTCEFTHGFQPGKSDPDAVPAGTSGPAKKTDPHHGRTALKAVAVTRTGWYFNVFLYCG